MKKVLSFALAVLLVAAAVSVTVAVENKKRAALEAKYASEMEESRAEIDSLRSEPETAAEERKADSEILTGLMRKVGYKDEPVYVIGHKSPDSDTTASAVGMAYLLEKLGIRAEARITEPVNLETEYGLSAVGYPAPEILEDAAGKQLWLVDHFDSRQTVNGADKARIVGITDHHGVGSVETSEPVNVLSCPAGSTSSLVYTLCSRCGVDISQDIAGVLLVGMLSDTANMKSNGVTAMDEAAFRSLKKISGISDTDALYNGMLEAKLSYKGMNDREIYYSDYKEYETNGVLYGIGVIKVARPELIPAMAERMLPVIESEVKDGCEADILLFNVYDPEYSLGYVGAFGDDTAFTEKAMETVFGASGEKKGEFYAFAPSLSRKTDMLPMLDSYLNALEP